MLVGRDKEIESLIRRISSPPKMATLEGLNGVGKTSIVNVACYRLLQKYLNSEVNMLCLPCRKIFQLNPNQDIQTFIDGVLMEVAQTIISHADSISINHGSLEFNGIDKWLNSPIYKSFQAGFAGASAGYQGQMNTSNGYERSGFRKAVADLLEDLFPTLESGGVICTIDNLELLQSSDNARQQLEQLRDELLNMKGLRWILCGALGIVYGVAASPRLEGFLHKPIGIGEIDAQHAAEILTTRCGAYSKGNGNPYLPLRAEDFARIYDLLRGNLRSVLSYADDYCQWVADESIPSGDVQRKALFEKWLNEQAQAAHDAVRNELRPKAVDVFKKSTSSGGVFSPSDFESYGFSSIAAFRPHIRDLEAVGLLVSTQDDGDKRRKTIQVTPKGWMVNSVIN